MSRTSRLALALVVLAACDGAQKTVGVQDAGSDNAALFTVGLGDAPGRAEGIERLIAEQSAAWADKDATAYAATYAVNAEVVNPVGGLLVGREAVRAGHAFLFHPAIGPFRASTSTWQIRNVTFLTGTLALVNLDVTLTGYSALPPGLPAVQPGVVRNRVSWLAVMRAGRWEIFFQQMTPLPPLP